MNRNQIIDLLTVATAFDQRTVGEADVTAWEAALADADFAAARSAIISHYREQTSRVMPADIRRHIRQNRRPDAIPFAELPAGAPDEPNQEYLAARAEMTARMAARDAEAMALQPESGERAAAWLSSHVGPGKPSVPAFDVPPLPQYAELPGDPPELRHWLAARRRAEATP